MIKIKMDKHDLASHCNPSSGPKLNTNRLFGLMVFISVMCGAILVFRSPIVFWTFIGICLVDLILTLVTLTIFLMEEKRKEREILEHRKNNDVSKRT